MLADAPVPLPACPPGGRHGDLAGEIHRWIASPPMRELVAGFGAALPATGTAALLAWLDDFSGVHWDYRTARGLERYQVEPPTFPATVTELIMDAAAALGLVGVRRPPARSYDHLLILGGTGGACLMRTEYAAHLVAGGTVAVPEVAALGSFRELMPQETALPELAGCAYEVDAVERAVRASFRPAGAVPVEQERRRHTGDTRNESWSVRVLGVPDGPRVRVVAAPSSEPQLRRANTPDTYEFWAGEVALRSSDRILVVTGQIYVPFQHCDAVRILGLRYGCGVDTVGYDPARVTPRQPLAPLGADRYLQELRSAIRSMRRLHDALTAEPTT